MSAPAKRIEHPRIELLSPPRPDIRLVHSVSEAELRALARPTEHPGVCFRRDTGRNRRQASSRGRRRGAAPTPTIYGISGWDASTALATGMGAGVAGANGVGVSVVVAWSVNQVPSGTQTLIRRLASISGYMIRTVGADVQPICGNGAVLATAPVHTIVADDVDKIHITCLSCDATAVYHYHDNAQVGVSTALSGYAVASARVALGSQDNGGSPASNFTILGACGRDTPLSLADFQTICAASKAAGRLDLGGISMGHAYPAPQGGAMPATVEDDIGSDDMTFIAGSEANVNVVTVPNVWGF